MGYGICIKHWSFSKDVYCLSWLQIDLISDALVSPCPRREENKLRETWMDEYPSAKEKAKALTSDTMTTMNTCGLHM